MASSKPEIKKPGTGGSLLAPSKFGVNFGRSETKRLFTGLKASKLTSITQSICSSSVDPAPSHPQQNLTTETGSGTVPLAKSFPENAGLTQVSSSCTPVISKVTLNVTSHQSTSPQKKDAAEKPKETSSFQLKQPDCKDDETSKFVFGQNLADRAGNFVDTPDAEGTYASGNESNKNVSKTPPQSSSFVFGQNLAERVSNTDNDPATKGVIPKCSEETKTPVNAQVDQLKTVEVPASHSISVSGTMKPDVSEVKPASSEIDSTNVSSNKPQEQTAALTCKTLNENAAEYFEAHLAPPKRKYDEVEVITGEENEHNVLHMSAKLYIFDKSKSWLEKGRGELRLNDLSVAAANATNNSACLTGNQASREVKRKVMSSRIVMRTVGSLRVILNTKVYHGMSVEKPNEKSVRLTGMDDGAVKVFLITCSPKDADALHCALKSRLAELKSTQEEATNLETTEKKDTETAIETKYLECSSKKAKSRH